MLTAVLIALPATTFIRVPSAAYFLNPPMHFFLVSTPITGRRLDHGCGRTVLD